MPPKTKITKEMIVDAAFEIARNYGAESINARTISQKLNCSTQPVMYQFKKIEDIKKAVYQKADEYHSAYITDVHGDNPMKEIGLLYIRFAVNEKNLFRFLFQSNGFSGKNVSELTGSEELQTIINILSREAEPDEEQARTVFRLLFLLVHGYASMFANNETEYDEEAVSLDLDLMFNGALGALKGGLL